jgi:hypothetical protein
MVSVCRCRCRRAVVNGSLDLAARAIAQHAFLFHLAIQGAAQKLALQRQMNRARGGSVVRRSKGTEQCDYVVTRVRIYRVDQNLGGYLKPKKCQTSPPQSFNATGTHLAVFRPLGLLRVNGQNGRYTGNSGITKSSTKSPFEVGQGRDQQVKVAL